MHLAELAGWKVYAVSRKDKFQYEEMPDGLPEDRVIPVKVIGPLNYSCCCWSGCATAVDAVYCCHVFDYIYPQLWLHQGYCA